MLILGGTAMNKRLPHSPLLLALILPAASSCRTPPGPTPAILPPTPIAVADERPDWAYWRYLAGVSLGLEVWEPEGTTPDGRWLRLSAQVEGRPPVRVECAYDGAIVKQWVADLDRNGQPELILWVRSFGTGVYGEVIVQEWDGTGFRRAQDDDWRAPLDGYLGHDEVDVDGDRIVRVYPVYRAGDSNCQATGGHVMQEYRYASGCIRLGECRSIP